MRQRGFIVYGLLAALVAAGGLGIYGWVQGKRLDAAKAELSRVEAEFDAFKAEVTRLGLEAERKRLVELERQKRSHDERLKSYEKRLAAARAHADGLCKSAGLRTGCDSLPAIPDTTRPVDDATRDQRLLAVLQHAQDTADRLAELQVWVAEQVKARGGT